MKLNDLIASLIKTSRKNTGVTGGLFMLTVEYKAEQFVHAALPQSTHYNCLDTQKLHGLRDASMRLRADWPCVVIHCHNPHVLYTNYADISLHVWKDGDNIVARCEKFRSLESRPSDVWVLDHEEVA